MSTGGAIRENTRRNESIDRGTATVTGSLVITVAGTPGPIRQVTHAEATLSSATAPALTDAALVTVGSFTNNTFTIYVWKVTAANDATLIASAAPVSVNWSAWGNLSAGAGF